MFSIFVPKNSKTTGRCCVDRWYILFALWPLGLHFVLFDRNLFHQKIHHILRLAFILLAVSTQKQNLNLSFLFTWSPSSSLCFLHCKRYVVGFYIKTIKVLTSGRVMWAGWNCRRLEVGAFELDWTRTLYLYLKTIVSLGIIESYFVGGGGSRPGLSLQLIGSTTADWFHSYCLLRYLQETNVLCTSAIHLQRRVRNRETMMMMQHNNNGSWNVAYIRIYEEKPIILCI